MPLASLLATLTSLDALPSLAVALGHHATFEPREPAPLAAGATRAAVVGRGAATWIGLEAPVALPAARAAARRLRRRGALAVVVAIAPAERRLAVAVPFDAAPSLDLPLDAAPPVAVACLERLAWDGLASPLAYLARAAAALEGEGVGRRFFRAFASSLALLAGAYPRRLPASDREALALVQLTRVLFLYFVQSKGWLDGRTDFLATEVDRCLARRRHLHRDLLAPLFFGTLDRPLAQRSRLALGFGAIPFLNGGLFEPHPLERRAGVLLPTAVWRTTFDDLFERFHFTVREGTTADMVAPDMLGRVFEGVMDPAARRSSGTFYTPAPLVRTLLEESLVALLAARRGVRTGIAERWVHDLASPAGEALAGVTVLDPACGSGAFLLGALDRLAAFRIARGESPTEARRTVLMRSLHGIDRAPMAVRLAELRLWLAVIADDPTTDAGEVRPLPNLDALVRQGDGLLEPLAWPARASAQTATRVAALRAQLIAATGDAKRSLWAALRSAERLAARETLTAAEGQVRHRIGEVLAAARTPGLFGEPAGLDAAGCRQLRGLRLERRRLRELARQLHREGAVPWFDPRVQFADVMARGGFDLVVGNPPWVRSEGLDEPTRRALDSRFRWFRQHRGRNRPDLSVAFLERGLELAAPDGVVAFLVPAKLATAAYATPMRHGLATGHRLHAVADLGATAGRAFDATVFPAAIVAVRRAPAQGARTRVGLGAGAPSVPQRTLAGGGPWILTADPLRRAAHEARATHPTVHDLAAAHLGVKTGANEVFLDPPADLEPAVLRWAVRGRDVRHGTVRVVRRLLWTHDARGQVLPTLPPRAAAWIAPHLALLAARTDQVAGPPWQLFRTEAACQPHRVIWPDIARELTAAALDDPSHVPLNTCYVVALPSARHAARLATWLRHPVLQRLAALVAPPAASGFLRFSAAVVGGLPLPADALDDPALDDPATAADAVPRLLGLDARRAAALDVAG